jgi:hypothetical protein
MEQVVDVVINNVLSKWSGFPICPGVKSAQEIMNEQMEEEKSIAIFKAFDEHRKLVADIEAEYHDKLKKQGLLIQ